MLIPLISPKGEKRTTLQYYPMYPPISTSGYLYSNTFKPRNLICVSNVTSTIVELTPINPIEI